MFSGTVRLTDANENSVKFEAGGEVIGEFRSNLTVVGSEPFQEFQRRIQLVVGGQVMFECLTVDNLPVAGVSVNLPGVGLRRIQADDVDTAGSGFRNLRAAN